jgi:hypothetical protein
MPVSPTVPGIALESALQSKNNRAINERHTSMLRVNPLMLHVKENGL